MLPRPPSSTLFPYTTLFRSLRHDPELIVDTPIAHRSAPRLARLATQSFEKRISRRSETDSKQKFDRRIEKVFLQRSEEHTSELQSLTNLVCRLLLEKKKKKK